MYRVPLTVGSTAKPRRVHAARRHDMLRARREQSLAMPLSGTNQATYLTHNLFDELLERPVRQTRVPCLKLKHERTPTRPNVVSLFPNLPCFLHMHVWLRDPVSYIAVHALEPGRPWTLSASHNHTALQPHLVQPCFSDHLACCLCFRWQSTT